MSVVPSDPALTQFISPSEFGEMEETFSALSTSGKSLTRLPKKDFDRRQIVSAFQEAFDLIGGVPRLAIWAHHNPTEFYKLYGKLIPSSSHLELSGSAEFRILPALAPTPLDGEFYVVPETEPPRLDQASDAPAQERAEQEAAGETRPESKGKRGRGRRNVGSKERDGGVGDGGG